MLNRQFIASEQELYLLKIVLQVRKDHPTLSLRAMFHKIQPIGMGRDAFELMCSNNGFKVEHRRSQHRTTDSTGVIRFTDLLSNLKLTSINQAFSSDITYYEVNGYYCYITFILDCFSRRIIGHHTSQRLTTEQTTLPALKMALKTRKGSMLPDTIFHSDGGGQYYDKEFLKLSAKYKMRNSMCEYAWENGKAEKLNGTIKNNYLKYYDINNYNDLTKYVDRAVKLYNNERPHKALGYLTPVNYEKKLLTLNVQTSPKMTKSLEANVQI
jgi:transposase InsO family protein